MEFMRQRGASTTGVLPAVLVLLVLLLAGCSSGPQGDEGPSPSTRDSASLPPLPEPTYADGAGDVSTYQADVLKDGVVTKEEYAAAVEAQRECVQDAGAQPGPIQEMPRDQLGFYVDVPVTDEGLGDEVMAQKVFDCASEYVTQIGPKWASQNVPTEDEYAQLLPPLLECLEEIPLGGLSSSPSRDEVLERLSDALSAGGKQSAAVTACMDENGDYFRA